MRVYPSMRLRVPALNDANHPADLRVAHPLLLLGSIMRPILSTALLLGIVATTSIASADATPPKPISLSASDVSSQLAPFAETIEHCYTDRASEIRGAGQLQLVVTVTRKGAVESLEVKTPGVPAKLAKQIDGCIRPLVTPVAFPARRTYTTATVPFFFQHTAAANAGPQESCWDAKGCPGK